MWAPELCTPIRRIVEEPRLLVSAAAAALLTLVATAAAASAPVVPTIADGPICHGRQEVFAPELAAPIKRIVAAPTAIRSDAIRDLGRVDRDDSILAVEPLDDFFAPVEPEDSTLAVDALEEFFASARIGPIAPGRVECDDPNLSVDALDDLFATTRVAAGTRIVDTPSLRVEDPVGDVGTLLQFFAPERASIAPVPESPAVLEARVDRLAEEASTFGLSDIQRAVLEFQGFAKGFHTFAQECRGRRPVMPSSCPA